MEISSVDVKNLREKTGAGMMDCKKALIETKGDFESAVDFLRRKGLADVAKKQTRIASEGTIGSYVHNGKIGVMVEVNCETDFVARNEEFQRFVKDVSMHIAASDTRFVRAEEMDAEFVAREKSIYEAQLRDQKKPENMIVKIVEGKIKKLASEICLRSKVYSQSRYHDSATHQ